MKWLFLSCLFLSGITPGWSVEGFRISEVVEQAGEGVEELTFRQKNREDRLLVKKAAILDERHVKEAAVRSAEELSVILTDEGSRKLKAATEHLQGRRLAIVVGGRVIFAPVLMGPLEGSFNISGNFELRELQNLARMMTGRPLLEPGEPNDPLPTPTVKMEPYSEEEYQARKAAREKMGVFHLEKVPSETELNAAVGMTQEEVVRTFGRPWMDNDTYEIAPEKRPGTSKLPSGFSMSFRDGKMESWGYTYSTMPREEKVVGREPGLLKMILPKMDMSADDFDFVKYFEALKVPEPTQAVNRADIEDLLRITLQVAAVVEVEPESKGATVNADCDLMRTLAHHFPEVVVLRNNAVQGRVRLDSLNSALMPYITGGKAMPPGQSASRVDDAGKEAGQTPVK